MVAIFTNQAPLPIWPAFKANGVGYIAFPKIRPCCVFGQPSGLTAPTVLMFRKTCAASLWAGCFACLSDSEAAFFFDKRYRFAFQPLYPYVTALLDRLDDAIDLGFRSLYLHAHRAIPFVFHPAGASLGVGSMPGSVPKADALHRAVEGNAFSGFIA